ncbi:hypothetical protein [Magnetospirillum gryphiswaldense]|uniref:hypothetical protein n=1 Tax=Magnetospirillum gryphiswaldense TaxID=55518 RepID=UPI001319F05B|nr:hypothetical protein [Magnetospirillum gryphiswaldense]
MVESTLSFFGAAPLAQSNPQALIDVVFIHGLGGGPIATWQHDGHPENFWPKWLAEDLGAVINVYSAG